MTASNSSTYSDPSSEEVYKALLRSLSRRKGFGILFVQCTPVQGERVIKRLQRDLPNKNTKVLNLKKPVDSLYNIIAEDPEINSLDIVFIQGLERSLEAYIKPGYGGDGDYYNLDTVPKILSHLNQRREAFRDHFDHLCFVFLLPVFAIKYIIRRAPDFFDWSSGVFELSKEEQMAVSGTTLTINPSKNSTLLSALESVRLLREEAETHYLNKSFESAIATYDQIIQQYGEENELDLRVQVARAMVDKSRSLLWLIKYEEALALENRVVQKHSQSDVPELQEQVAKALVYKGVALSQLGRGEEAIAVYEQVVQYYDESDLPKLQEQVAWALVNKGFALDKLGRGEEAMAVYEQVVQRYGKSNVPELQERVATALINKGITLNQLGRGEEAIAVYDQVVQYYDESDFPKLQERVATALINKGITLNQLGRGEEAIAVYDQVLQRYSEYDMPQLQELVVLAVLYKEVTLNELAMGEEAHFT
jgi:tetratricopeptide (TPR) repeat protein